MSNPISPIHQHPKRGVMGGCHPVHAAGNLPNPMDRFLLSNMHEVLFVN